MTSPTKQVIAGDFSRLLGALGDLGDRMMTSLDRQRLIVDDPSSRWAVVPTGAPRGALQWWLVADDNENERRGREVVNAFFGRAITRPGDGRDEAPPAHIRSVPHALRLHLGDDLPSFVAGLELMTSVRASAPQLRRETRDPIGWLLRDFYLALERGHADTSDELLSRIEGTGLVGSENLRFLRVDRLARLGRWRELGALPWFSELARARRPIRISEHLLEAAWTLYFDDAAVATNPEAASDAYERAGIATRFGVLLRSIDIPSTSAGRRLAALFAGLSGDTDRVDRIVRGAPTEEWGLLERLAGRSPEAPTLPPRSALDTAHDMFEDGNYEGVVAIAEREQSPPLVAMAIRAAYEQNDPRLALRVVPLIEARDAATLPGSAGFVRMGAAVRRLADNACGSWSEWLDRVGSNVRWPDAAEIARDLSTTWDVAELGHSAIANSAAERLLSGSEGLNRREVRAVFDLLCQIARQVASSPAAARLVDAVLLVLSSDENPSALVRAAFFDLLMDVLANGPASDRYQDMLSTVEFLWSRVRSREATPWILDVLDGLASHPSPDEGARQALVSTVVVSVHDFASRLTRDERMLFEAIGKECHMSVVLPPIEAALATESREVWSGLNGKLIGIYSLIQGIGARLNERLTELCHDVRVEQNSDTVATAALRALAVNADFLIVDTKHASHAATGAIDAVRPRDRQLFPAGGGISSLIARLREDLELLP